MDIESLMYGYDLGGRVMFSEPRRILSGELGAQLSRRVGSSLEFMEHRDYFPGDDLRRIDWNAYARGDRLAVKLFREEVYPHIDLLLDVSRSMNLVGSRKGEATYALAGFFSSVAAESRYSFRVFLTDDGCRVLDRSHLTPLEWESFELSATNSPNEALFRQPPEWKPHGIRILVSDFLFNADPALLISRVAEGSAVTILVQLLAEADVEPLERGYCRLTDSENEEELELYVDLGLLENYKRNLARHQDNYRVVARRCGVFCVTVIAEHFLNTGRLDELFDLELLKYPNSK
ncbi:MAG: DUF58 domain-containing protein [Planctomycetaceae bacterium]|jgi:uncharacterized protein (DUF58 family)|nr:DUF58 domain-containing protein [Planctomycetaceae bacterium]